MSERAAVKIIHGLSEAVMHAKLERFTWRPIADAPDDVPILIYSPEAEDCVVAIKMGFAMDPEDCCEPYSGKIFRGSHWMPLPDPPNNATAATPEPPPLNRGSSLTTFPASDPCRGCVADS